MAFEDIINQSAGAKQDEGGDENAPTAAELMHQVPLNADPTKGTESGDTLSAINKTSGAADLLAKNAGIVSAFTPKPVPSAALTAPQPASPTNAAQPFSDIRPGSMADKMHGAITKAFSDPASQKPGGATAALFAGVMGALTGSTPWDEIKKDQATATTPTTPIQQKQPSLFDRFAARLGDTADNTGFAGAAKNYANRTRQENEDRRVLATANAQMLHEQAMVHKLGEDAINDSIKTSTAAMNNAITPVAGAPPEAAGHLDFEGKTSDDLRALLSSGQFDPSAQTAFATGRRLVGKDTNGLPMYRTTYSVITPAKDLKVNPENAKYMNAQLGTKYATDEDTDKQNTLSGVQYLGQMQRAQTAEATKKTLELNRKKLSIEETNVDAEYTAQNMAQAKGFPAYANAVHAHQLPDTDGRVDGFGGYQAYKELERRGFFNDPANGISAQAAKIDIGGSEKGFEQMEQEYRKSQVKAQENVDKTLTRAFAAEHPEGSAAAANAELTKLNAQLGQQAAIANSKDPAVTPEQKTDALNKVAQIQSRTAFVQDVLNVAKGTIKEQEDKKASEAAAAEAAKGIDLEKLPDSELMNKILNYQIDPERMAGIRGNQREKFMEKVAQEAKNRGVDWSEAEYKQRYQTVEDFRPGGQFGKQIIALNTFGKHAGMAEDHIDGLYNTNFKLWNKGINAVKENLGATQYAKMRTDLGVAKKEYLNFLNAGHAETEEDRKFADKLTDENSSPAVIKGVLQEMAATVQARAESMNQQYKATMQRGDFPHMFDQRTAQYLRRFGLDLSDAGSVIGEGQPKQTTSGKVAVQIPGRSTPMMFDTQAQADAFKKEAGIQ